MQGKAAGDTLSSEEVKWQTPPATTAGVGERDWAADWRLSGQGMHPRSARIRAFCASSAWLPTRLTGSPRSWR